MFLKSFEQIRETFKETFVRFFPGGEADLRLEENVDALEAHIDIIARRAASACKTLPCCRAASGH